MDETASTYVVIVAGVLAAAGTVYQLWRLRRVRYAILALLSLVISGHLFLHFHRLLPESVSIDLFDGVHYIRDVRQQPRPIILHVIQIQLDTPGIEFLVTPRTPANGHVQTARTTSQFLREFGVQLAINADSFYPWHDYGLLSYYPRPGDPVNPRGLAASEGDIYSWGDPRPRSHAPIYLSAENRVTFGRTDDPVYNAVSGLYAIVENGQASYRRSVMRNLQDIHPRTALALDETGRVLILLVIDGRQPSYSEGVNIAELAELVIEFGGYHAVNLDGGGSTTLVIEGEDGQPQVLNSPIHGRIPGRERPIANHLGIYAPARSEDG
jgi:hypothetical protein